MPERELAIVVRVKERAAGVLKRMGGMLKSFGSFLLKIAKWAGVAMAAIGGLAANVGKNFEFAVTSLGVTAGATAEQMGMLEAKAREIGRTTAFSAKQAADAMWNLASAGLSVTDIMASAEDAIKLAGATAGEMALATRVMAATMKAFNFEATQSTRVADVFAKTISSSMFSLESFTEAMKFAGTTGAALNWTLEETAAAVATFADLGLEGSMAGTNLRSAMKILLQASDETRDALASLGVTFEEVSPATHSFGEIVERLAKTNIDAAKAIDIFGGIAGTNMAAIIDLARKGQLDIIAFTKELENSAGTASKMYEQMMDTVEGQWQILKSTTEELLLTIFDSFRGGLKAMLTATASFVADFIILFQKIAPSIVGLTMLMASFGAVVAEEFRNYVKNVKVAEQESVASAANITLAMEQIAIGTVDLVETVVNGIRLVVVVAVNAITGFFSKAFSGVLLFLQRVVEWVNYFVKGIESIAPHIPQISGALDDVIYGLSESSKWLDKIGSAEFSDLENEITSLVGRQHEWRDAIEGMFSKINWAPIMTAIQRSAKIAAADSEEIVNKIMNKLKSAFAEGLGDLAGGGAVSVEGLEEAQAAYDRLSQMAESARLSTLGNMERLKAEHAARLTEFDQLGKQAMNAGLLTLGEFLAKRQALFNQYKSQSLTLLGEFNAQIETARLAVMAPIDRMKAEWQTRFAEFDALGQELIANSLLTQEQYLMGRNALQAQYDAELSRMNNETWYSMFANQQTIEQMMAQTLTTFVQQTGAIFGQFVTDLVLAQNQGGKEMVKALARMLGQMAANWGNYFVLMGIAKIAEGLATFNPLMVAAGKKMIVGGVALIALGGVLGAAAGGGRAAGGGGGGGFGGGAGGTAPGTAGRGDRTVRGETRVVVEGARRDPNQEITLTGEQFYSMVDELNNGLQDGNVILDVGD